MSLQLPPTSLIPEPSTGSTSSTAELYQSYNTNDFIRPGTNVTTDRQGRGSNVSSNSTKKATRTRSYVTVLREQLWKEEKLLRTIHDKVIEELRRLQIEESILQKIILEASQHQDSSLQTSTHLSPSLSHFDSLSASTFTQDHQNMLLPSSSLSTPSESLGFSYEEDQSDYMLGWDALGDYGASQFSMGNMEFDVNAFSGMDVETVTLENEQTSVTDAMNQTSAVQQEVSSNLFNQDEVGGMMDTAMDYPGSSDAVFAGFNFDLIGEDDDEIDDNELAKFLEKAERR